MTIRKKLFLTAGLLVLLCVVLIITTLYAAGMMRRELRHADAARYMARAVAELSLLSESYITYREPRMETQWRSRSGSIDIMLTGERAPEDLRSLRLTFASLRKSFDELIRIHRQQAVLVDSGTDGETLGRLQLIEERIIARMRTDAQNLLARTFSVADQARHRSDRIQQRNTTIVAVLSISLMIIGVTALLLIGGLFARGIGLLTAGAREMERGRLQHRIPLRSRDEIGALGQAFNTMAAGIETMVQKDRETLYRLNREIDERKRVEQELRRSEETFRLLVESSPDAIFVQTDWCFRYLNRAAVLLFGASSAEELIGTPVLHRFHTDYHESVRGRMGQLNGQATAVALTEEFVLRLDGSPVPTEVCAVPLCFEGDSGALVFVRDISERLDQEAARERLQEQLLQARRMESVGRLAGGVAHYYNNLLSIVVGYTQMSLEQVNRHDPLYLDLEAALSAAERCAGITRQLLAFARRQTIAPQVLDINERIGEMLPHLVELAGTDIDLDWQPGEGLAHLAIDPVQLQMILENLCANARDAIGGRGRIIIETSQATIGDEDYGRSGDLSPGDYLTLTVSDTGRGMDRHIRENLFEPFYTTKEVGMGTGLGLPTVYGIVKQNGGEITVYSEPNQGSSFKIYLPIHDRSAFAEADEPAKAEPATGETILVVDNDQWLQKTTRNMLLRHGYTVLSAASAAEAIRLIEDPANDITLLLTDVVMPEMNGPELASYIGTRFPQLKVLFMSGFTAHAVVRHGILSEDAPFIQKPFLGQELALKVQRVVTGVP